MGFVERIPNFYRATLWDVDLRNAELQGAILEETELQDANLEWAKLQGAILEEAELQGADLEEAELQGAILRKAKLQGANLRKAKVYAAGFAEADLSVADFRGLVSEPVGWNDISGSFETMVRLDSMLTSGAGSWPDNARELVQTALSRFWDIAFDPPFDRTLPAPSQAADALYDHRRFFAADCNWPSPPDVEAFEEKRAAFLANLSCYDRHVAKAIGARAFPQQLSKPLSPNDLKELRNLEWHKGAFSKSPPTLAQTLLNKAASNSEPCPELAAVVEEDRKELEHIRPANQTAPRHRAGRVSR